MAVSRQSSPTGAIIYAVVATIGFVLAAALAIMFYVGQDNAQKEVARLESDVGGVIPPANARNASDPDVAAVREIQEADDAAYGGLPLFSVARSALRDQSEALTGNPDASPSQALDTLQQAVAAAQASATELAGDEVVADIPATNALAAINALSQELNAALQNRADAREALERARQDQQQLAEQTQAQLAQRDQAVEEAQAAAEQARSQASQFGESTEQAIADLTQQAQSTDQRYGTNVENLQSQTRELQGTIARQQLQIQALQEQLPKPDAAGSLVTLADGEVQTIAASGNVYINLGQGDGVSRGMTFEVYSRTGGIPRPEPAVASDSAASPDEQAAALPSGKASLEVLQVSPGSSECRVVAQSGPPIQPGDLIVNLAYDRSQRYNFYVYGEYDLDRDGRRDPQDIETVRELIRRWGGQVADVLDVDTDFVILGGVPRIPANLDPDNPLDAIEIQRIQDQINTYNQIVADAKALDVAILNQNQFLAYTGYYDLARR